MPEVADWEHATSAGFELAEQPFELAVVRGQDGVLPAKPLRLTEMRDRVRIDDLRRTGRERKREDLRNIPHARANQKAANAAAINAKVPMTAAYNRRRVIELPMICSIVATLCRPSLRQSETARMSARSSAGPTHSSRPARSLS